MDNNRLEQYAIGDLLDGRYFYIPAFQRGYRWTTKQVGDLLHDLLVFSFDKNVKEDEFYSLQPIIARPMTAGETQKLIDGGLSEETVKEKGVWEIIDGQQRLTTLFLIYKCLLEEKGWDAEKLKEEESRELYHLSYATRKGSMDFLEGDLSGEDPKAEREMDFFYMLRAYRHVGEWIKTEGKELSLRYGKGDSLGNIRDALFRLLNAKKNLKIKSVQVLWYELQESQGSDSVKEFQKLNTGKLPLTEAELIKSLFLQSKNFETGSVEVRKAHLALEWEHIEDTLREDSFWYFLRKRGTDLLNRIDLLFSILYKRALLTGKEEGTWPQEINKADKELENPRNSILFRQFFNRFEGKQEKDLQTEIEKAWKEVTDLFRLLDDWYSSPELYNLVGLLSQFGEDIVIPVILYDRLGEHEGKETFAKLLKERIQGYLPSGDLDSVSYKDGRSQVFRPLLALNVALLSQQIEKDRSSSESYKFPFDLFNAQKWDIEHIDSFHTNTLKRTEDKTEWIRTSMDDLGTLITEEKRKEIEELKQQGRLEEAIDEIKKLSGEEEYDEETKNSLGNLTLLDEETNRSYGNKLFCTKRRIIIERMQKGVFVPIGTQFVFAKYFDRHGTNRSKWTQDDMKSYSDFISNKLKYFDTASNADKLEIIAEQMQ